MSSKWGTTLRLALPVAVVGALAVAGLCILWWKLDAVTGYVGLPASEKLDIVRVYLLSVGGLLLIWQIHVANRRATSAERTTELTALGNITERLNSAIVNLGSEQKVIRIGSLHQLHHIARDASDYRRTVFDLVDAHSKSLDQDEDRDEWDITTRMLNQDTRDGGVYYDQNAEDGPRTQS